MTKDCCIIDNELYCKKQDCKGCPWEFDLDNIKSRKEGERWPKNFQ